MRVGDFVLFSDPRKARPMPVRAVETMTASLMGCCSGWVVEVHALLRTADFSAQDRTIV
jgi:hypothetical protein